MSSFSIDIPGNEEMYQRIVCGKYPNWHPDKHAQEYWNKLKDFSEKNGLIESSSEVRIKDQFHSYFWELYLPMFFNLRGISLVRGKGGQPDFYFDKDEKRIWLEAVACGDPKESNQVPVPDSGEFFEMPGDQITQRMASSLTRKSRNIITNILSRY